MKLDPKVVADLALPFHPKAYLRIMPEAHAATPLGMGFGQTRFAASDNSFQLIYLARNLATAIAETVVCDRFEGKSRRILDITEVEDWVVSEVTAKVPLTLVDLRTTGLLKLGVTTNAARAKGQAAGRRWPMTELLDVLKEAALDTGFLDAFETSASRVALSRDVIDRRLLLCLYGLGTNAGLKRVAGGCPDVSYEELLRVNRHFVHRDALEAACARVANATLAIRNTAIWGETGTACASDSKKFRAWDDNLMTEWHVRYGGRGVMIYWHVEKGSTCIYSQLRRCSSSEVGR